MKKQFTTPSHRRTLVSLAVAMACSPYALAAPAGQQVVAGSVTVTRPDALSTVINQGSQAAIVNWQQFSIGAAEHVDIRQPNASSVLLNRVIGNNPSEIYGRLSANGQVFLVNPNGVLFGRNAQVSVGGLVASTLDIANDDFLAGRYQFQGNSAAAVSNLGSIQAAERGTVALLGGRVNNDGTISAQLGTAALAAGEKITLDFEGDGLTRIRVDQGAVAAQVANRGLIVADGGQAVMTASAAQALADTVLNQQGVVRARSLVERDGKIVLDGGAHGVTLNSGALDASGGAGLKGGTVNVLGHHVGLVGQAAIDASGSAGGGQVYVGGGVAGANPLLRNAAAVFAGPQASVRADATGAGHGGTVVLWSDGATRMFGAASAQGGAGGGNGGFIETSGKFLDVAGARISASAPRGKAGTWLLDPYNIDIVSSDPGLQMPSAPNFVSDGSTSQLWNQAILNELNNGTSVTVTTGAGSTFDEGNINVGADIVKSAGGDATLTLNAANNIRVFSGIKIGSTVGALNLDFNADADNANGGTIDIGTLVMMESNGGNVRMYGQSDAVNGFASGYDSDARHGVVIDQGAVIDTTSGAADGGAGSITIRGRGYREAQGGGDGVFLDLGASLQTGTGNIAITGIGGEASNGVTMLSSVISTTNGGNIDIRGTTIPDLISNIFGNGIYGDDAIISTAGPTGNILLSGQAVAAAGVSLGGSTLGSSGMSGDIVIRAYNTNEGSFSAGMLDLPSTVATQGVFAMLPGGVDDNGNLVSFNNVTINLGNFFISGPPSGEFAVNELILGSVVGTDVGAVVLGSDVHTGLIKVTTALGSGSTYNLSLNNGGAGSAGIELQNNLDLTGRSLMLASGGSVTQAGAITAANVLLFGAQPEANFTLTNAGNSVGRLASFFSFGAGAGAADGDVRFVNSGALQLGNVTLPALDGTTYTSALKFAAGTMVTGDLDIQASGNLNTGSVLATGNNKSISLRSGNDIVVDGGIAMNGTNSVVDLTASRDIVAVGNFSSIGANLAFTANAGRDISLTGGLNALAGNAAFVFNSDAATSLGGGATLQGDSASLTVNAGTSLLVPGSIEMSGAAAVLRLNADINLGTSGPITMSGANGDLALETAIGTLSVAGPLAMTGSNPLLRLTAGLDVLVSGNVSSVGGANVHSINADRNIIISGGSFFANPASAPLHLDFNADADNLNGGVFGMNGGAAISTSGGALRVYGQSNAAAGYATGESQFNPNGISLSNASINTGSGALTLRGRGNTYFSTGPTPVFFGDGVNLGQATLTSTSGNIAVTGMGGQAADGISMAASSIVTTGGGAIDLRGRSGAVLTGTPIQAGDGVVAANSIVRTSGAASNVVISGESIGGSGIALSGTNALGNSAMSGNVVLRAFNTASSAAMLSLGGTIQTSGTVNLRPGGVSAAALLTEQPATVINLGGALVAGQFNVNAAALDAAVLAGTNGVVIGSAAHSGAILAASSGPLSGLYDLTLQNDIAGSGGISIGGLALPGALLTLSSGGAVTQSGPLAAGALLLRGTQPQSSFVLNNTGNVINALSATFLQPKGSGLTDGDLNVYTSGSLALGAFTGTGFDSATNVAQVITAPDMVVAGDLVLGAGVDLNLTDDIRILASDATLTLNAGRDVNLGSSIAMQTPSGALQMNVNADADNANGGAINMTGAASLASNGGNINLYGQSDAVAGYASGVSLAGTINAAGSGGPGTVQARGRGVAGGVGVAVNNATITTGAGAVTMLGFGGLGGTGVQIANSQITTTAGGVIDIRGQAGADNGAQMGAGVLTNSAVIGTAGGPARLALTGQAFGSSGLAFIGTNTLGGAASTGDIVLRASNTSTARTLDASAQLQTTGVVNIRPGALSATGALVELPGSVINIGSSATAGEFSMTQDLFVSGINAAVPTVTVGSAAQTGAINVLATAPLGGNYNLSLQNDGAGSGGINLYNGLAIPGRMLTLSSGGTVNQGAAIVAGRLMLHGSRPQSSFQLVNTGNAVGRVSSFFDVLKGTAPTDGDVNFYSTGNLEIGPLTGIGYDSATGLTQAFTATNAVIAGDIVAQAGGNLNLLQNVSTLGSDITLVTGGVLLNPGNSTLSPGGGGRWRVFADTWVGEVDGGLTGTAPTPNFYNCLFGAACMSLLPATNNYFVYRQQPVLNVVLTTPTQTRAYGAANPAFAFTASGLVNGDALANSLAGAYNVPAALDAGSYVVPGAFTSPVGYLVNAAPGTLNVTPGTLTYVADAASRPSGQPNPTFTGTVTGFISGDTLAGATTGALTFTSTAPRFTPTGQYAIDGSGLIAKNYVFQQAPGNQSALTVTAPLLLMPSIINEVSMPSSDLYGANFGVQRACVGSGPLASAAGGGDANDTLAMEWARVRETPNLSNCVGLAQRYSCGDF